jgi:hypothetical protein
MRRPLTKPMWRKNLAVSFALFDRVGGRFLPAPSRPNRSCVAERPQFIIAAAAS